jgi:ABC-type multidrug transport system fused ATPase/permease subunit
VYMINTLCFNIIPTVVSYVTVTVTLVYFNGYLGLVSTLFFIAITVLTSFFRFVNSKALVKKWISAREKASAVGVENLTQNALIRSSFATPEVVDRYVKLFRKAHNSRNIMVMGGAMVTFLGRMLYILSVLVIGYGILNLVQNGTLNAVVGTTIILTYMSGSRQILRIGDTVGEVTESMANVTDLFEFIRKFGKQTFPVLPKLIQKNSVK